MEKIVLCAVSFYEKKCFFNNEIGNLPKAIEDEVKAVSSVAAEKIRGIVIIGFYKDFSVFIETSKIENDFDYDEIGARLVVESLKREKKELLNNLSLWFKLIRSVK